MTRFLSLLVAVVCALAVGSASAAQAAVSQNSPEAAAISFYTWLAHIQVQRALMLGDVAVVPVSFGSQDPVHVLVFLKRVDATWKIIKIDDTWEYR